VAVLGWWAVALFYLTIACLATWVSRRSPVALVGLTLALCSAATSAAAYGADLPSRVTLEAFQSAALIYAARTGFKVAGCRACIAIVALALGDLAYVVLLATGVAPLGSFGAVTNLIFSVMCLCVAFPGVRDAVVDRRDRRFAGGVVGREGTAGHARISAGEGE
jgi:hypothetical protein